MKHFVLIFPSAIPQIQNMITNHLVAKGFGYWHWCAEVWLLTHADDSMDAAKVRGILHEILVPELTFLVLYVELPKSGVGWAFAGTNTRGWKEWLQRSWENPNWENRTNPFFGLAP